jgi:hypothetical protein
MIDKAKFKKVYFAIPSRDDRMNILTAKCVYDEAFEMLVTKQWVAIIAPVGQINPIHASRNRVIMDFLATDCTDLIFWDEDVICERGAAIKLLEYPVDFVGGCPPHKKNDPSFPVRRLPGDIIRGRDGLISVEGIPFGLVRLSRKCVEKMAKKYADLEYQSVVFEGGKGLRLFSFDVVDGQERSKISCSASDGSTSAARCWSIPTLISAISAIRCSTATSTGSLRSMWC